MKELNMAVWITQLGISVAAPLAGFALLGLWLQRRFGLGSWVVVVGCVVGLIGAASGLRNSLKAMEKMDKKNGGSETKPVSFNDHD